MERACDSRNLALSLLCPLTGLESFPWLEDAVTEYKTRGREIPSFLSENEGRSVEDGSIKIDGFLLLYFSTM